MGSKVIPKDLDIGLSSLTPAQRLFLFYYAQCPDVDWAAEKAGCSSMTVKKKWKFQPAFAQAWRNILEGDVTDIIKTAAKDQAGKSFARIIELRDQDKNARVALDAAKACLRAIEDPTFQSHVRVTKDIGANWMRVLRSLGPEILRLSQGQIVDADDWHYIDDEEPKQLEDGEKEDVE